ncbi:MAG: NmrA family NAD(P)-binding protein [Polyangiaceae bacterium]|nr:NmrA family NAD(P)-binding protein [Polyangiaceae bacterium]
MSIHHDDPAKRVLVTGATGTVGRHVVAELQQRGVAVRALTRDPTSARIPEGVEVLAGDLAAPETFARGLEGVGAVFLVWPFFSVDAAPAVLEAFGRHAKRIVYLSAASVNDDLVDQPGLFHADVEKAIVRSGMEWTFLRPTGFATNVLMWASQIRDEGVVRWPYAAAARSLIHERDIAAVAARTLVEDGHDGAKYVLTGPETVTQREQVHLIGQALKRPVHYEELSPEKAREVLIAAWGSPSFADAALSGWANMVTAPERVTRTVQQITGRPARSFREWANEHVEDFGGRAAS